MFKKITIIIFLLISPLLIVEAKKKKNKVQPTIINNAFDTTARLLGAPLPQFRAVSRDGKIYNNTTEKNDANFILMLFNPACGHCEDMTLDFEKHIYLFKNSKLLLLATEGMMPYMEMFETGLKTNQYPTVKTAIDSSNLINKLFNYQGLPQINIYNHNRKLIRTLNGIETIDSLKKYIE